MRGLADAPGVDLVPWEQPSLVCSPTLVAVLGLPAPQHAAGMRTALPLADGAHGHGQAVVREVQTLEPRRCSWQVPAAVPRRGRLLLQLAQLQLPLLQGSQGGGSANASRVCRLTSTDTICESPRPRRRPLSLSRSGGCRSVVAIQTNNELYFAAVI